MKKQHLLLLIPLMFTSPALKAQSTSDILESGIRIDKTNELRLKFENNILKYKSATGHSSSFVSLDDSPYFLSDSKVNIYIITPNPLNYSVGATVTYTTDAISKAQDSALQTIITSLKTIGGGAAAGAPPTFVSIQAALDQLQKDLAIDNKKTIANQFALLKGISFAQLTQAQATLAAVNSAIGTKTALGSIIATYNTLQEEADKIKSDIASYLEPAVPPAHDQVLAKKIFSKDLDNLTAILNEQLKWVANLINAYKMVNDAMNAGVLIDGELVTQVSEITVTKGKIANVSIVVNQDGLQLSTNNDIVATTKSPLVTKVVKFRQFQRFVFEMASGIAYANIDYPKYGTETNSSGQTVVASAGDESFRKFNLTAMFNWNYYVPNSDVHPFFQLGIGANSAYPAFFTGVGLRFNSVSKSHLAISAGFASSWVQTLNKLKIGDVVTGTADISKDATYEFHWPLKPYFGIQYNF